MPVMMPPMGTIAILVPGSTKATSAITPTAEIVAMVWGWSLKRPVTKVASREERELFAAFFATDRVTTGMRMAWSADLGEDALA